MNQADKKVRDKLAYNYSYNHRNYDGHGDMSDVNAHQSGFDAGFDHAMKEYCVPLLKGIEQMHEAYEGTIIGRSAIRLLQAHKDKIDE